MKTHSWKRWQEESKKLKKRKRTHTHQHMNEMRTALEGNRCGSPHCFAGRLLLLVRVIVLSSIYVHLYVRSTQLSQAHHFHCLLPPPALCLFGCLSVCLSLFATISVFAIFYFFIIACVLFLLFFCSFYIALHYIFVPWRLLLC